MNHLLLGMTHKMRAVFLSSAIILAAASAWPHEQWADGSPVPPWVKAACCGPEDVHHLRPEQVHQSADGRWYTVDGYNDRIPAQKAQPSQDGDYWIFYRDNPGGNQSGVFCFFVPMVGSRETRYAAR